MYTFGRVDKRTRFERRTDAFVLLGIVQWQGLAECMAGIQEDDGGIEEMLSHCCLRAYSKMYPKDLIGFLEPSDICGIDTVDGHSLIEPDGETDARFMKRLRRCTPERNVFIEEWPEDDTDYGDPDVWF